MGQQLAAAGQGGPGGALDGGRGRRVRGMVLISIAALIVVVGLAVVYALFFRVDPHKKLGLRDLQAKNYEDAASEFRLCLERRPDDHGTKGLLAYAVLRDEIEQSEQKPEELSEKCLLQFLLYYSHLESEPMITQIKGKPMREWTENRVKDAQREIRGVLKRKKIPFRDWVEFRLGILETSKVVFSQRIDPDDDFDRMFKDIASAVLARSGDREAAEYLMSRCAEDERVLTLTLVAGEGFQDSLQSEVGRKGSFIESEGAAALSRLRLVQVVRDFAAAHPGLRVVKKSDLPEDQRDVYADSLDFEKQWYAGAHGPIAYYAFGGVENQIVFIESLRSATFDPSAIRISEAMIDDDQCVVVVGGFDSKNGKFVSRILVWDTREWKPLRISGEKPGPAEYELLDRTPLGDGLRVDEEKSRLAVPIRYSKQVTRTYDNSGYRPVVRYRKEYRYNPRRYYNDYYETWVGGYEYVDVPYEREEYVVEEVEYKERAVGDRWEIYKLDPKNGRLWFQKSRWLEDEDPFAG